MPVVSVPGFTFQLNCFTSTIVQIRTLKELRGRAAIRASSQFTCFTSTKVQIAPEALRGRRLRSALAAGVTTQFTCFISTKVQILTPEELRGRRLRSALAAAGES